MLGDAFGAIGDYFGGRRQAEGMKNAVDGYNQQLDNTRGRMTDLANEQFGSAYNDINQMYNPYQSAGQGALGPLSNREQYMSNPGQFDQNAYNVNDYLDPSMDYEIEQAMRSINSGAGAGNQGMSGKTLKALSDRSQAIANQNFGDAFSRMRADRGDAYQMFSDDFNRMRASNQDMLAMDQNMANMGMNATNQNAQARQNQASGMMNALSPSYGTSNQSKAGIHDMTMGNMYGNMGRSLGNLMEAGMKGGVNNMIGLPPEANGGLS